MDIESTARDAVVAAVGPKLARAAFREELREAEKRLLAYADGKAVPARHWPGLETALMLIDPDRWHASEYAYGVPEATTCAHGQPFAWQTPNAEPPCPQCLAQSKERHASVPRHYVNPATHLPWTRCYLCTKALSYYTHTTDEMIAETMAAAVEQLAEIREESGEGIAVGALASELRCSISEVEVHVRTLLAERRLIVWQDQGRLSAAAADEIRTAVREREDRRA